MKSSTTCVSSTRLIQIQASLTQLTAMNANRQFHRSRWLPWLAGVTFLVQTAVGLTADLPPLTTASGNPRLPGKFVWADLVTDDVLTARKFYAQLFGWTFWEMGNYSIALNEERPMCG